MSDPNVWPWLAKAAAARTVDELPTGFRAFRFVVICIYSIVIGIGTWDSNLWVLAAVVAAFMLGGNLRRNGWRF